MKGKLSDPSPFNNILNNIQFLLAVVGIKHSYGMEEWEFWLVYVYEKESERKQKENERKVKGNERKMKRKLSDPSPFNNILNFGLQ